MRILIGVFMLALCSGSIEIDIDRLNRTSYSIHVGDRLYMCETKKPPVSHGWSYECNIIDSQNP